MQKFLLAIVFLINITSIIFPQYNPGAKQIALANSDVGQSDDVFSIFNNPGGLSQMDWREIGIYYSPAPFGIQELANGFIAYHEPFHFGSVGIGAMTYGFELYRESRLAFGFSYKYLNRFFGGIAADYHNVAIKGYGSAGTFYIDAGVLIYITDYIRWGFSIHNLNHASLGNYEDQIPVILNTGTSIDIPGNLTLDVALEKDIRYNASIMFGLDYQLIKYLSLRSGFSNEPSRFTAGVGIHYSLLNLDYAVFTHIDLGLTHQAGLILNFGSDKPRKDKIRKYLGIKEGGHP